MPVGYPESIVWRTCPYCKKWVPEDKIFTHYEMVHMMFSVFERNKKLELMNREN